MDIEFAHNWEMSKKRYEAWWNNEIIDRPLVWLTCPREKPRWPLRPLAVGPESDPSAYYLDPEHCVDAMENALASTDYFGDAVPTARRGVNTAYLGLFAGAVPEFAPEGRTVWIRPFVEDWEDAPSPKFDPRLPVFQRILVVSKALAENAKGRYLLSMPDHLDAVTTMSQMRGVESMSLDFSDRPEAVYAFRDDLVKVWLDSYDFWFHHDRELGFDGTMNWAAAFSTRRVNVTQCDFSSLISPQMFRQLVRPELAAEGAHLDATLYHMDGPGQIPHLDMLCEMPEITAIQWVPGEGNPPVSEHPELLLRAQAAGKPIQIRCAVSDLDAICDAFDPEGVMLVLGFSQGWKSDPETCRMVMRRIEKWAASTCRARKEVSLKSSVSRGSRNSSAGAL